MCLFVIIMLLQSPELEYRHELMGRLHKLDADVELEIIHNHSHGSAHGLAAGLSCGGYTNGLYDSYGKEYYYGESMQCGD